MLDDNLRNLNILEVFKQKKSKTHLKEGESPRLISLIYQPTFLDKAILRPKIDLLLTRQNKGTIVAI